MSKYFITQPFTDVNDNSAREYNQSVIQYLFGVLENSDWRAMSDHQLFLDGGKTMLREIIELLNEEFTND